MNNKGFTLVELITTFAVASAISLVLFNVVLSIKDIYSKTNMKTNLLINQSNLSSQVNSKVLDEEIIDIDLCEVDRANYCYKITYTDGSKINLVIKDRSISFGNYVYKLEDGSYIALEGNPITNTTFTNINDNKNGILNIKIPIKNDQLDDMDYGLNFVYLYNVGNIVFNTGVISNN